MATIAQLNTANKSNSSAAQNVSYSHTISGNPRRMLFVVVYAEANSGSVTASSATYNGVSMTKIGSDITAGFAMLSLFYLLESQLPAAGAYTLTSTYTAPGGTYRNTTFAIEASMVHQTTPLGTSAGTTTTGTAVSQSIDTAAQDIAIAAVVTNNTNKTVTTSAPQTEQLNISGTAYDRIAVGTQEASGATATAAFTFSASTQYIVRGVAIKGDASPINVGNFFDLF